MITKNQIKFLRSLSQKKYRIQSQKFLVEGKRIVKELIQSSALIDQIYVSEDFIVKNADFILFDSNITYEIIPNDVISKIKTTDSSQEVFAISFINNSLDIQIQTPILVLDDISDPGNLGTLLRSASWYGINNVLVSSKSVDIYNPKVVRSAMGAHFHITNLHQLSEEKIRSILNDESINIIAATLNGSSHKNFDPSNNWALILGNEAHGVTESMLNIANDQVSIPKLGNMESLNVGVAGSVLIDRFSTK
jgi:TrmH family RNA methyltransferase